MTKTVIKEMIIEGKKELVQIVHYLRTNKKVGRILNHKGEPVGIVEV